MCVCVFVCVCVQLSVCQGAHNLYIGMSLGGNELLWRYITKLAVLFRRLSSFAFRNTKHCVLFSFTINSYITIYIVYIIIYILYILLYIYYILLYILLYILYILSYIIIPILFHKFTVSFISLFHRAF